MALHGTGSGWRGVFLPTDRKTRRVCREIECLLYDSHQKVKMMIMIMKTPGSQVDSPVAEGNRKEGDEER